MSGAAAVAALLLHVGVGRIIDLDPTLRSPIPKLQSLGGFVASTGWSAIADNHLKDDAVVHLVDDAPGLARIHTGDELLSAQFVHKVSILVGRKDRRLQQLVVALDDQGRHLAAPFRATADRDIGDLRGQLSVVGHGVGYSRPVLVLRIGVHTPYAMDEDIWPFKVGEGFFGDAGAFLSRPGSGEGGTQGCKNSDGSGESDPEGVFRPKGLIACSLSRLPFYADVILFGGLGFLTGIFLNMGAARWAEDRRYVKWVILGVASYGLCVWLVVMSA